MQSTLYMITNYAVNFLLYMSMLIAVQINCKSRFSRWITVLLEVISFSGYIISSLLPYRSFIRAIYGFLYVILIVLLLFKEKWYFKIISASASVLAMLMADVIFEAMLPRNLAAPGILMQQYPIQMYSAFLFIDLVAQTVNVVFVRLLSKRMSVFTNKLHVILSLVFPINQFITLWLFFSAYINLDTNYQPWQFLPTVLIFILSDIALLFLFRLSEKNAKIQIRNEILEDEISNQTNFYEQLSDSYDNIRKIRHDIDNHMYTIQALLSSGQFEEAANYARKISAKNPLQAFASCANIALASFLENKKEDLEQKGITLNADIHVPKATGISDPDLICVFGNILDNAMEACTGYDNAAVEMRAYYQEPYLSINCVNPIAKNTESRKKRIPELERGLGILILKEMAKKYDGELQAVPDGDLFRTQLVLKGDKPNA